MTYEFNVDRFYAQLGAFSIFVISHERGVKPGSNWISCSVNLMLMDFRPNWAFFFFIFVIFGWGVKGQNRSNFKWWWSRARNLKTEVIGVKKSKKRQGMCHLDDTALSSFVFFQRLFLLNRPFVYYLMFYLYELKLIERTVQINFLEYVRTIRAKRDWFRIKEQWLRSVAKIHKTMPTFVKPVNGWVFHSDR